jgi:hypothetical protein
VDCRDQKRLDRAAKLRKKIANAEDRLQRLRNELWVLTGSRW